MMRVRKSSVFSASKKDIFVRLQELKTLQYIAAPYAAFEPIDGENDMVWKEGAVCSFRFRLFGIIPFGVHTINVKKFGLEEGIFTEESNTHVPVWNHAIMLEEINENTTRYTDCVDIDAGWKTPFVYLWAVCFYSHRQRKWKRLIKKHF